MDTDSPCLSILLPVIIEHPAEGNDYMKPQRELPAFEAFISDSFLSYLLSQKEEVSGVEGLSQVGPISGLENPQSLQFVCDLYNEVKESLDTVLKQRDEDRAFIDEQTKRCLQENQQNKTDFNSPAYKTVLGLLDERKRTVAGPLSETYLEPCGDQVAEIPSWLAPPHVTLFGPPNSAKMAVNAMNAWHRQLPGEPAIVSELLSRSSSLPKWGADDEDSKTPIRADLMDASVNLADCFSGTISITENDKEYRLAENNLALPIKRIPGISMPCSFLFYNDNPLPLHLYDFGLHLFHLWDNPSALVFYIPKLENEEEARYFANMVDCAEKMIQKLHPEYTLGTIRLLIVLEHPRAIFRTNEIMDALYPYFAGASLGWHDFLASTARLFKEDSNYRIPVKSDPDIVIKHIKASHELLARVVGPRGGIKIGGMYGVLPTQTEKNSPSFQVAIKGFIRDVIVQLRRGLDGFWVAHPDFVRIGIAIVQAWYEQEQDRGDALNALIEALLLPEHAKELLEFLEKSDIESFDIDDPRFARALLAADLKESALIPNNDEQEVRYNVFQSLQYLTDWLAGNGCVALPATIEGQQVRVMDDLATAERSRWEVWHEIHHGRFDALRLAEISLEELEFIRQPDDRRQVEIHWDERTARWYPISLQLMLLLMTSENPVEFASELLLPFTVDSIRQQNDPLEAVRTIDPEKYQLPRNIAELIENKLY